MRTAVLTCALLSLAACSSGPPVNLNDGFAHMNKGGTFNCPAQPVSFDGSHADLTLQGPCPHLRVTGSHNDVIVYLPPGAVIEASGGHNDIVYRLLSRGAKPQWVNTGESNELIRNSRASWEQDHDWYQEQH